MRTLTVYVVRHADDAPMSVHPTIKAANEYLAGLAEDNDGEPLCIEWHTEARTFQDNSTGAAQMMSLILSQCADELIAGAEARRILFDVQQLEQPIRDLEVGNPEVSS